MVPCGSALLEVHGPQCIIQVQQGQERRFDADTVETARSLAYNRPVALCYTRDKLLFYKQQRRAATRRSLTQQTFWFEAGYFSNHYYLLMWGGVDQTCWVINEVFQLGFDRSKRKDWNRVGPAKTPFLDQLKVANKSLHAVFKDADFIDWFKMLRGARHYAAHHGIVTPSQLLQPPAVEPSEEEIEKEVEAELGPMKELQEQGMMERDTIDWMRKFSREKKRLERHTVLVDDYIEIEIDRQKVGIRPLLNVAWDYENYTKFVEACAEHCCAQLRSTSGSTS